MKITEYEQARTAAIVAYRNRLVGGTKLADGRPLISGRAKILYEGNFPFQAVADEAPVPHDINNKKQVAASWQGLYDLFEKGWKAYVLASVQDRQVQRAASAGPARAAR